MNKQQAIEQVATLEKELAELKAIINQPESCVRKAAENGERYYFLSTYGVILFTIDHEDEQDIHRFNMGNYYLTKEEAEKARDRQLAYVRITDAIREQNKGWVPDWTNMREGKYVPSFNIPNNKADWVSFNIPNNKADWVSVSTISSTTIEMICTKEAVEYVIKHHADDIKLYLGVE